MTEPTCDWLTFHRVEVPKRKTPIIRVLSQPPAGALLGQIKWHGPWRQFAFFPETNSVWTPECMQAISDYIDMLNEERA